MLLPLLPWLLLGLEWLLLERGDWLALLLLWEELLLLLLGTGARCHRHLRVELGEALLHLLECRRHLLLLCGCRV